jgi:hypothetical protein
MKRTDELNHFMDSIEGAVPTASDQIQEELLPKEILLSIWLLLKDTKDPTVLAFALASKSYWTFFVCFLFSLPL